MGRAVEYPLDFPNGMTYAVGSGRWTTDWNYVLPSLPDAAMLKAIHAQEDLAAAREKAAAVVIKLREMKARQSRRDRC